MTSVFFSVTFRNCYVGWLVGWLVRFYGISTFVGYLMPNPFLYKKSVLFKTIQLSMRTQFNCQKHFFFKQEIAIEDFCILFCQIQSLKNSLLSRDIYSVNNVLQRTSSKKRASVGRPASIYSHQLCADTRCCLEDLPGSMDERGKWRERERERERERQSGKDLVWKTCRGRWRRGVDGERDRDKERERERERESQEKM